ncbi:MAG: hypothetical protein K6F82_04390 [Sphaerochaetaceae bacterium]|nr:hypothetical protein [Sphaerochaetaceae bacterium]
MAKCPYCGSQVSSVYYSTTCPSCSKSLHTCKCCKFYSPYSHYGCRESVDELVQDKERPNFCDYFSLREDSVGKQDEDQKKKAEDLFNSFFS